jgi:uncharacterized damage-inducible protein DinB
MAQIKAFLKELEQEGNTTRRMLTQVPTDKFDWQPHTKSMTIRSLATHIAELPTWIGLTLYTDGLDFATSPYQPEKLDNSEELLAYFERCLAEGKIQLENVDGIDLSKEWVLRHGDTILNTSSKAECIRMTYCQIVHHRAQLGVYLRLLDIPIPGSYGPSADMQW